MRLHLLLAKVESEQITIPTQTLGLIRTLASALTRQSPDYYFARPIWPPLRSWEGRPAGIVSLGTCADQQWFANRRRAPLNQTPVPFGEEKVDSQVLYRVHDKSFLEKMFWFYSSLLTKGLFYSRLCNSPAHLVRFLCELKSINNPHPIGDQEKRGDKLLFLYDLFV